MSFNTRTKHFFQLTFDVHGGKGCTRQLLLAEKQVLQYVYFTF